MADPITPIPGRRLDALAYPDESIGSDVYGEKNKQSIRLQLGVHVPSLGPNGLVPANQLPDHRPNVKDYNCVGDGVTDDTPAALGAADTLRNLVVPPGDYFLTEDVYLFGEIANGVRYTGAGKFITLESVLELTKWFFIQEGSDPTNTTVPNFIRRAIEPRRLVGATEPYANVYERTPNSTSLGLALRFFSMYALNSPSKTEELIPYIAAGADYLCAMQYRDSATARYGGIKGAVNDNNTTSFGTSVAARGLLAAYKVTRHPNYLQAARRAVNYLKVMADPNPKYQSLYGQTPIPNVAENVGFTGFCDRMSPSDVITITASGWNLMAAVFLQEMYEVTGDAALPGIIADAQSLHDYGVLNGFDYFAVKNASPTSKVSVSWPFFSGHSYADGAWHRLGEPAGTNTVGTDQIEYGLSSLYDLGYDTEALRDAYETYRDLVHADVASTSFGAAYSGAVCFTGYFRINSANYGGVGGAPIDPATSRAFGGYYDVQGAGTLLKFKYQQYPDDFKAALSLTRIAWDRGALVDEDFNTIWSTGVGFEFFTKGVIPISKAATGLLEVMEAQP